MADEASEFNPSLESDGDSTPTQHPNTPEPSPHRRSSRNQQPPLVQTPPHTPVCRSRRQQLQTPHIQPQKKKGPRPSFAPGQKFGPKEPKMPAQKMAGKAPRKKPAPTKKPAKRRQRTGGRLITIMITIKLLLIQNSQGSS